MRNRGIVLFVVVLMMGFGIWSLPQLNKDEFPQFDYPQGVIAAIYPGATAQEVEAQVTRPIEDYINGFAEVDKENSYSQTEDGVAYFYIMLRRDEKNANDVWTKVRAGLGLLKKTKLPQGVLEVVLVDDFGNTSSILLAVEGKDRTPRELEHYARELSSRLRTIPEMGRITIMGQQQEEIAVEIDPERMSAYGVDQRAMSMELFLQGFRTMSGQVQGSEHLQVDIPYQTEEEIKEQILWITPSSSAVRLGDISHVKRRYEQPKKWVEYYENGEKTQCVIVNIEMVPGNNIVEFGRKVEDKLDETRAAIPQDIRFHRITDQPKVVSQSVMSFMRDILISVLVVIGVMLLLFPIRTALVASTGVPVCIAICWGMMYLTGIELNTVTLAALIFVLGMIVDDSVIVIDGYTNMLDKGHSRWYSAAVSTNQLFVPMSLATCAISGMFFPMTKIITGPLGDFVKLFPWAVLFALTASIFYAAWVTPRMATAFVRRRRDTELTVFEKVQNHFFSHLQRGYEKILGFCFREPWPTYALLGVVLLVGVLLLSKLNLQLLPKAERECFAVEIHLREGSSVQETEKVMADLAMVLSKDERVKSVTAFVGQASPRFHATYTPQMARANYGQFIVNTVSMKATEEILREYGAKYEDYYANAYCRFKQMDYQSAKNPVEVYVKGTDFERMELTADTIREFMSRMDCLHWVHTDYDEFARTIQINLNAEEAARLGVTESALSLYLGSVTEGVKMTTIWEDDYAVPVMMYAAGADTMSVSDLENLMIPTAFPGVWVPLRQVADLTPAWHHSTITHRNGIRTITIGADLRGNTSQVFAQKQIERRVGKRPDVTYGGLSALNDQMIPEILVSIVAALLVMFALMMYHFGKVSLSLLALSSSVLCLFGSMLGLWIFNLDISITAVLGIVSLIGIIVRNAIMMYEYAEELVRTKHLSARDAAFEAGLRRMRPVFLTSATTALGVLPMIIAHTSLWMPMGVVICFGTIFTLPLTITILPVLYWKIFEKGAK